MAVMSARFSCTANVLCIAALLALAARKEMFFPITVEEVIRERRVTREKRKVRR